jgi:hypothetical protein
MRAGGSGKKCDVIYAITACIIAGMTVRKYELAVSQLTPTAARLGRFDWLFNSRGGAQHG